MTTTTLAAADTVTGEDPGCVDCGWKPESGELWPTEGKLAVRWIEKFLICAEGDWYGKPIRLRKDQKAFLYRWYEFCPACGYWHYDQAVRGAATGDGKTTFVAAIECLEMFGPQEIVPVSPNIVNAAASFEQADKLFGFAGTMLGGRDQIVKEAPLVGYAEVYDTEIKRADGTPGIMQRVAAVAGTNEGGLPTLFVCDEVHEWGDLGSTKARVHTVIGKSTSKRRMVCRIPYRAGQKPHAAARLVQLHDGAAWEVSRGPGRILNISTAGFDVDHSLLGAMYKQGLKALKNPSLSPRMLFDWREARPGLDFARPEDRRIAVQDASAAAGVLWDVEKRVREYDKDEVEENEWIRYYANSWVRVPADSWLKKHPDAWGKCVGTWELAGDEPTILAVDMALNRDSVSVRELVKLHDGVDIGDVLPEGGVCRLLHDGEAVQSGSTADLHPLQVGGQTTWALRPGIEEQMSAHLAPWHDQFVAPGRLPEGSGQLWAEGPGQGLGVFRSHLRLPSLFRGL